MHLLYRTALVTGASSGIGWALAKALAKEGTRVVLCARRMAELERLAAEIQADGGQARAAALDVADTTATAQALRALDREEGGLDLVIANAGVSATLPARKLTWEAIEPLSRVNFTGALCTLTAVLPQMLERGRGHLVGISSLAAYLALPGSTAYSATKAGLSMFLSGLRLDLRGTGVHATAVQPGFVDTPLTQRNKFRMPFLLNADQAADLILRRMHRAPAVIDFPLPTALGARIGAALPRGLVGAALGRTSSG